MNQTLNDFPLSSHFNLREFACRCCGAAKVHPELVARLEDLRKKAGVPLLITSGYRCPRHNREVGGKAHSFHMAGMAADIRVAGGGIRKLAQLAEEAGFGGIGLYPDFLHVDLGERRRW